MDRTIYLDNNATTMIAPEVLEAMLPFLKERYGNPSSMHSFGGSVARDVAQARMNVASFIGAEYDYEIVFTGTGTESDNMAIMGSLAYYRDKRHIITTRVEHPAVISLCKKLEKDGYRVTYIRSTGRAPTELLKSSVDDDTALVSVMFANNETGVINPVNEIGAYLKERGIPFHVDAVQAAGKVPIDVKNIQCDLLTISGHKFHAPKGIGALYVRRGTRMRPILYGGHQEKGRRPGTENVPGIIGMGTAAELAMKHLPEYATRVNKLRDRLEAGILGAFKNAHLNGNRERRVPNTTNVGFEYIEGEAILLYLDQRNCRVVRLGLLVRFSRAVARAPGHGRSVHVGAWLDTLQPFPVHEGRGRQPRPCGHARGGQPPARDIALLGQRKARGAADQPVKTMNNYC